MSDLIAAFVVWGEPKPKERPRFGKGHTFTSKATQDAENAIVGAFDLACPLWVPVTDDIRLEVEFHRKGLRIADLDNLSKTPLDALNGVLYADDAQITELHAWRHHKAGDKARTVIRAYYA